MTRSRLAAWAMLFVLSACPGGREPVDRAAPSPPPEGLSLLYAVVSPDEAASINRFDLRSRRFTVLMIDRPQTFGELIGRNYTRSEQEAIGPRTIGVWVGSPAGRFVAHLTNRQLRVSTAGDPLRFKQIAAASSDNHSLGGTTLLPNETHVMWAPDESHLYYLESRHAPPPPPNVETHNAPLETRLYEVRRDGKARRLVKRFREPKFVSLVGFDQRRGILYWIQTGPGGGAFNLTAVDVVGGTSRLVDALAPGSANFRVKVSRSGNRAFFIDEGRRIFEIDLASGKRRILHESSGPERFIQSIQVSPDGASLVFEEGMESGNSSVLLQNLATGRTRVLHEREYGQPDPAFWSPEGRYLVLLDQTECGSFVDDPKIRLLDVHSGQVSRLPGIHVSCPTEPDDRGFPNLRVLTWLAMHHSNTPRSPATSG